MKKNIFLYLFLFVLGNIALCAQIVYTPRGSKVNNVSSGTSYSTSELAAQTAIMAQTYPNAILLSSYSNSYNCHGYAWHMSEGGDEVWIDPTPSIYWTDGSYLETTSDDLDFEKIYYVSTNLSVYGDHSAIRSDDEGYFVSKWGSLGLYKHLPLYCPYENTTKELRYFKLNEQYLKGPSHFCSSGVYYVTAVDDALDVSWKVVTRDFQNNSSSTTNYTGASITIPNNAYMSPKCYDISVTVTNAVSPITYSMKATSNEPSPYVGTLYWKSGILSGATGLSGNSAAIEFNNQGAQTVTLTSYVDWAGYEIENPHVDGVSSLDHYVSYSGSTITLNTTDTPVEGRGELEVYITSECNLSSDGIPFYIPYVNLDMNSYSLVVNDAQTEMTITSNRKSRSISNNISRIEVSTVDNINLITQSINNSLIATVDITGLAQGVYYVAIVEGDSTIYYKKLIID